MIPGQAMESRIQKPNKNGFVKDKIKPCDLCQLPIEVAGYELMTQTGLKCFCCEGCEGIYRMLHGDELLPEGEQPKR